MRYVSQENERMKAGLAVYIAEFTNLRRYLNEHDGGKVCSPSQRMKSLLAKNVRLRRANSGFWQNSAERGLDTDALILSTARLSTSSLDWVFLGLSLSGSGASTDGSSEHSPLNGSSMASSAEVSVGGLNGGGLFDGESTEGLPRKRKRLRQRASAQDAKSTPSKLPAARWLSRPSVGLKRETASAMASTKARSGHKIQPSNSVSTGSLPPTRNSRSPPISPLGDEEIDDEIGGGSEAEVPVGNTSQRSPSISDEKAKSGMEPDHLVPAGIAPPKAVPFWI
ncbi:LOW QUALITY PROTEIN: hypothetical protein PHMEG_0005602 [Phytophthora megakarya]|uniref:Uncharacterized protein n=1 Tax=Phytophthora megakarya TaxID=4795 RepID=A0A225WQY9_9STRA|nr:LOW QUALITY PROTEIN: hypothetical protein PHMEG_0005600 [Phytophthora megakarya]OWZ20056.1 LOW QUALITY PROTEIN: hypothetical protein PHMEG_0005602 [Phytophthora megakarya]